MDSISQVLLFSLFWVSINVIKVTKSNVKICATSFLVCNWIFYGIKLIEDVTFRKTDRLDS